MDVPANQASAVMNVLIVHAHPEPKSFNSALTRTAVKALREQGHTVEVSDLYAKKWKPAADADDYAWPREDEDYLRIDREQTFAHEAGTTACDIVTGQAKVRCADLVLFQHPMWWFGPPAILKGWFDRVFTRGFAYLPGRKYDTGLMAGKLAMVSVTTGTSADTHAPDGIDGAILDNPQRRPALHRLRRPGTLLHAHARQDQSRPAPSRAGPVRRRDPRPRFTAPAVISPPRRLRPRRTAAARRAATVRLQHRICG